MRYAKVVGIKSSCLAHRRFDYNLCLFSRAYPTFDRRVCLDAVLCEQFWSMFVMVFGGEVLADWIKHGFIIKFNQLTPSIYEEYSTILARYVSFFLFSQVRVFTSTSLVSLHLVGMILPEALEEAARSERGICDCPCNARPKLCLSSLEQC